MNQPNQERANLWQNAKALGLNPAKTIKTEELRALVLNARNHEWNEGMRTAQAQKDATESEPEVKETVWQTPDAVDKVIAPYLQKQGFTAEVNDTSWSFKFRGAEDSGSMSMPLSVIRLKAELVARGAKVLPVMARDGGIVLQA